MSPTELAVFKVQRRQRDRMFRRLEQPGDRGNRGLSAACLIALGLVYVVAWFTAN